MRNAKSISTSGRPQVSVLYMRYKEKKERSNGNQAVLLLLWKHVYGAAAAGQAMQMQMQITLIPIGKGGQSAMVRFYNCEVVFSQAKKTPHYRQYLPEAAAVVPPTVLAS
jgi:hypothetical protein